MGLPKEWPVLTAKNMEIGPYCSDLGDCGCLQYWEATVTNDKGQRVDDALCDAAETLAGQRFHTTLFDEKVRVPGEGDVPARRNLTRHLLARIWNLAGAILGYVKVNPEAKTAAKLPKKKKR